MFKTLHICSLFFLLFSIKVKASGDSTQYQSLNIGYYMLNDNDPISNQKGYDARNRDDHGLTFMLQFHAEAELHLIKNTKTKLRYENYCGLFTKGFGTLTKLPQSDTDYEYFSYILKEHPDWDNILLYDQVAVTKNVNTFYISNQNKNLVYGLGVRQVNIDTDLNQKGTRIQHEFHKTLKVRNFYHKSFLDSSVFKGTSLNYMALSLYGGYYKSIAIKPKFQLTLAPTLGFWYNATNAYTLNSFSPFIKINLNAGLGKTLFADIKRLNVGYQFYMEPMERLQMYSDPGTQGNNALLLDINFAGKKAAQLEQCTQWLMLYKLNLFSMHMPFGKINDTIMNYSATGSDKGNLLGFVNFSVVMVLR
jgi:hypothetical protein